MYRSLCVAALVPAYNEEKKIGLVVGRIPRDVVDVLFVIDDGSTDDTAAVARAGGAEVLSMGSVKGVGYALREGLTAARARGCDVAVILAGNNKDEPKEITRLLDPIVDSGMDLVMGSRFLAGGHYGGDMPAYRKIATRLHPFLMSLFTGKKLTETTNGFRAVRLSCLDDPRLNLGQRWLDGYGLEVYMVFRMIVLGYKHTEVPCTKVYPPKALGVTKMKPVVGWWDILKPVLLLGLRIRE